MENDNLKLRYLLCLSHGCHFDKLNLDDDEMYCNSCKIDFKRASPIDIGNKVIRKYVHHLIDNDQLINFNTIINNN